MDFPAGVTYDNIFKQAADRGTYRLACANVRIAKQIRARLYAHRRRRLEAKTVPAGYTLNPVALRLTRLLISGTDLVLKCDYKTPTEETPPHVSNTTP